MILRSAPEVSLASSASQPEPQRHLMTFQPAPRNWASSSWTTLPLPRTGPSRRCRLQLMTNTRLSSFSRAASELVILVLAVDRLLHDLEERAARVLGEERVPARAPEA